MSARTINLSDTLYTYLMDKTVREAPLLRELRQETAALPAARMQISPEQGQFMALLVELLGARKCIEVGVFTGYSSLRIAMALPDDGKIVACDVSEEWTNIAARYWQRAGVAHKIELHLQPATETLQKMVHDQLGGTFDFAFIDADKGNYERYYELCLELLRPGGLIAIDNVLWGGSVADPSEQDADTVAIRRLNDKLHEDMRVTTSLVPIGDGLYLARKR